MKLFPFFILSIALASCSTLPKLPKADATLAVMQRVNDHWQSEHPIKPATAWKPYADYSPFWQNAAYHTGNMAAWQVTHNDQWLNYSRQWAEGAKWMGATSNDTVKWKYSYGEKPEFVLFGDWQICFQTYAELWQIDKTAGLADDDPRQVEKLARARGVMEYEMSTPKNDYWWWADGLYMVMPVMVRLGNITGNPQYGEKLYEYWMYAKNLMYDKEAHLFYRDGKYIYPKHKSTSGKKDFWARGDGWVFASLARCMDELPADYKYLDEFRQSYPDLSGNGRGRCRCPTTGGLLDTLHARPRPCSWT